MNAIETELVQENQAVATRQPLSLGVNVEALLEKAIDAKSAVEVLERLQVMRREMRAEAAEEAFNEAMASFQAECPVLTKTKFGAKDAYKYCPLDQIVTQLKDLIQKHGFSFSITSEIEPGWIKAICKITHRAGHSDNSSFKVPIDQRATLMNAPQQYGASMTFAKRYAFCNAFGILTAEEDLDGRSKQPKPPGPAQATPKTKAWFLEQIKDIQQRALTYAIDKAIIMPNQTLEDWPLEKVPVTNQECKALRKLIEAHV